MTQRFNVEKPEKEAGQNFTFGQLVDEQSDDGTEEPNFNSRR